MSTSKRWFVSGAVCLVISAFLVLSINRRSNSSINRGSNSANGSYTVPPYDDDAAFCATFNRQYVRSLPTRVKRQIYTSQTHGPKGFKRLYEGRLRSWLVADLKGLQGDALADALRQKVESSFVESRDYLRSQAPELAEAYLLLAHTNHLIHAHLKFATYADVLEDPQDLMCLKHGDCSELAMLDVVLLSLCAEDARLLSI